MTCYSVHKPIYCLSKYFFLELAFPNKDDIPTYFFQPFINKLISFYIPINFLPPIFFI